MKLIEIEGVFINTEHVVLLRNFTLSNENFQSTLVLINVTHYFIASTEEIAKRLRELL